MLDWLRLIRATGLFTILSNIMAATVAATYAEGNLDPKLIVSLLLQGNRMNLLWVALASCLLYASGMIWNDIADIERDRELHPRRPLPSGRISLITAYVVAAILAVASLLVASLVGSYGFYGAGIVLSLALLYDFAGKHVPYLGSLNMALVRFAHALFALLALGDLAYFKMGVLAVVGLFGADVAQDIPLSAAAYPLILGGYVLGVTLISELESRRGHRWELAFGGAILFAAVIAASVRLVTAHWIGSLQQMESYLLVVAGLFLGLGILGLLLYRVLRPWIDAVRTGRKALVGPVVGAALSGLVLLDALVATAFHPLAGLAILALYPVFRLTGRLIRMD
ncbi:MAG: UbiA family prenyltransferase [Planctomycetes bacterium]|nr:UbiA family prenyltransferase [Planctomycetota bacterium]